MTAPDIIAQLVERFDRNRDDAHSDRYTSPPAEIALVDSATVKSESSKEPTE